MKQVPSILVIDSGVGGLSVCQSILATDAHLQIIYFADDAYAPYGLLDEQALEARLEKIVASMLAIHQPSLVVLACNTVSTLLLPQLRAQFLEVSFVGVVPAIKPAASHSKTNRIGLLATPATVRRSYTDSLIENYAGECEVVRIGSNALVLQAEALLAGKVVSLNELAAILAPFKPRAEEPSVDTIVLGCTHFPLLKPHLKSILPDVSWIDSGEAVAKRVHSLLHAQRQIEGGGIQKASKSTTHQIYFSKSLPDRLIFKAALEKLGLLKSALHQLSI